MTQKHKSWGWWINGIIPLDLWSVKYEVWKEMCQCKVTSGKCEVVQFSFWVDSKLRMHC